MGEPAEQEPAQYLVPKVREALAHDDRVNELEIKVKIYGKKVFLTGVVPTKERCKAIDDVLHDVLPDYEIHNETTVATLTEPVQEEQLS